KTEINGFFPITAVANYSMTASAGNTLTFNKAAQTVTASTGSFLTQGFALGQTVVCSGSMANDGIPGTITALTATVMTLGSYVAGPHAWMDEGPDSSGTTLTANTFQITVTGSGTYTEAGWVQRVNDNTMGDGIFFTAPCKLEYLDI